MSRAGWWIVLVLVSVVVLALDLATGPYIQFPILFVVPVGLAAWKLGRGAGLGFTLVLIAVRVWIVLQFESHVTPGWAALVNAAIRLAMLATLAVLVDKVARQGAALAQRVEQLEGILPICGFCKKIRQPDGSWQQIEQYVSERSQARFSHGFCEQCARIHYAEYFTPEDPEAGGGLPR